MEIIISVITGISGIVVGLVIASTILRKKIEKKSENILKEAEEKGEVIKKEKILQAKEKFLQLKSEHDKIVQERNSNIQKTENRLNQKETSLSQKLEDVQRRQREIEAIKHNLNTQLDLVGKRHSELEKMHKKQVEALETIATLSDRKSVV